LFICIKLNVSLGWQGRSGTVSLDASFEFYLGEAMKHSKARNDIIQREPLDADMF